MAVAVPCSWGVVPRAHAAAPEEDFEQHLVVGDAHMSQERHADALEAYGLAVEAMDPVTRASAVGEFVAVDAGKAALQDFNTRADPASLERGIEVLDLFIATAESAAPGSDVASTDKAKAQRAELVALRPPPQPVELEPVPDPALDVGQDDGADDPVVDDQPRRSGSKRAGIALVVAGGVTVLGGAGLIIAGIRQVPWYEEQLQNAGWDPQHPDYRDQVAAAERIRSIDVGIGAGLAVVGIGLGIGGGLLLARAKNQRDVAVSVGMGRTRAMLGVRGRF